jgi:hypothetical protein
VAVGAQIKLKELGSASQRHVIRRRARMPLGGETARCRCPYLNLLVYSWRFRKFDEIDEESRFQMTSLLPVLQIEKVHYPWWPIFCRSGTSCVHTVWQCGPSLFVLDMVALVGTLLSSILDAEGHGNPQRESSKSVDLSSFTMSDANNNNNYS